MNTKFKFIPATKRVSRKRRDEVVESTPELSLVSAVYSINDAMVTLTFNRAINTDEIDTHAFKVYDGIYANQILDGATYSPSVENGIVVYFDQLESYSSSTCLLNVSASSGIKDASTSEAWDGVTGFRLTIG